MSSNTPTSGAAGGSSAGGSTKVDCTRASQTVWLLKIPKYISEVWSKTDSSGIVGNLRIPLKPTPNNVSFHLASHLTKLGENDVDIPEKHKFIMSDIRQNIGVFSETPADEEEPAGTRDKVAFEGRVTKRADCRPIIEKDNDNYMQMKKKDIERALQPKNQTKLITGTVKTFKPVSDHASTFEPEKKKSQEKRVRHEREHVLETILSAFEKHQFYTLKDLIGITQQPVTHLKSILRDVCVYNLKNPHKNTYELKPEYRHYKDEDKDSSS